MALIEKTGVLKVGYDLIDNDHNEFINLLNALDSAANADFPALFQQFKTRIDKGMLAFGRSFVRERLPQWFGLHVTTMDSALAAHIKMQSQT